MSTREDLTLERVIPRDTAMRRLMRMLRESVRIMARSPHLPFEHYRLDLVVVVLDNS
jgi:hypothetical protein